MENAHTLLRLMRKLEEEYFPFVGGREAYEEYKKGLTGGSWDGDKRLALLIARS